MSQAWAEVDMDLAQQLTKYKEENFRLTREKNDLTRVHLEEVRRLSDINEKLQMELEDLRDLCCYLDDDRIKCRNLAKEWQNFGRHISSVLHTKESSYQEEMNSLNVQQETILAENINLKRLCHELENCSNGFTKPREYICIRCSQRISLERGQNGVVQRNKNSLYTAGIKQRAERIRADIEIPLSSPNDSVLSQDSTDSSLNGLINGKKKKVTFIEPSADQTSKEKVKHKPLDINSNVIKESKSILRKGSRKHGSVNGSTSSTESNSSPTTHELNSAMQALKIHPHKDGKLLISPSANIRLSRDNSQLAGAGFDDGLLNHNEDEIVYEDLL